MARTELSRFDLPAWAVPSASRDEAVAAQEIRIRLQRALLTSAAERSRTSPQAAFEVLRPAHRNAIGHLGPSFFTKFLYWAKAGPVPEGQRTWTEYCAALGSPAEWTDDDRRGLRYPH